MRLKKENERQTDPLLDKLGKTHCCRAGAFERNIYLHIPGGKKASEKVAVLKVCLACKKLAEEALVMDSRLGLKSLRELVLSGCDWVGLNANGELVPILATEPAMDKPHF